MTFCCHGTGISSNRSLAIGKARIVIHDHPQVYPRNIPASDIDREIARFQHAVSAAHSDLRSIQNEVPSDTARDINDFISSHLLMLEDRMLTATVEERIRSEYVAAEWALQLQHNSLLQVFDRMEDPYLQTRRDDITHVVNRVLQKLFSIEPPAAMVSPSGCVVIASDLSPADIFMMKQQGMIGFITEYGGPMSHAAILARSLGLPAIIGLHHATRYFSDHETVVIDAQRGIATASPEPRILQQYRQRLADEKRFNRSLRGVLQQPAVSRDGQSFELHANIELPEDIQLALMNHATAIGLYRTEFLYMNRSTPPGEEEQLRVYRQLLEQLNGLPLTLRTLDLGADKSSEFHQASAINPALGLRAVRLCLRDLELFKTQLRAILRASAHGPVNILVPMLSNILEVEQVKNLLHEVKRELRKEGQSFADNTPLGGMIEVPAAALAARSFARKLDFLSIGTNDLIQYTLAIDRLDEDVNYLYNPVHPAVIRLLSFTIEAAQQSAIPVSMCGEMAGEPRLLKLLVALGLTCFSMQPNSLPAARKILLEEDFQQLQQIGKRLLEAVTQGEDESASEIISSLMA